MIELRMPALSPTMEEGTLAKWLVAVGDRLKPGDVIAEVETDKATMEFEAIDEGFVTKLLVREGTDGVPVGTVIALLDEQANALPPPLTTAPLRLPETEDVGVSGPSGEAISAEITHRPSQSPGPDLPGRHDASPLAKAIALARGIDLTAAIGSGVGGRILRTDLPGQQPRAPASPAAVSGSVPGPSSRPELAGGSVAEPLPPVPHEVVRLTSMRRTIAHRLTESKLQIPHIYLTVDARLDALLDLRARLNADLAGRGVRISVNDLLIRALALALIQCPEANVQFRGDELVRFRRADISVAVSVPGGLVTPVITAAETKGVAAISAEVGKLVTLARDGGLVPEQYRGGTASLSNLGMFGIRQFDAVINPPQAMILAVGQGEERVVPRDGMPVVATVMSMTGSFDHRAIDGADAARMMGAVKALVEEPLQLLA